jgi:hypothetical protein
MALLFTLGERVLLCLRRFYQSSIVPRSYWLCIRVWAHPHHAIADCFPCAGFRTRCCIAWKMTVCGLLLWLITGDGLIIGGGESDFWGRYIDSQHQMNARFSR